MSYEEDTGGTGSFGTFGSMTSSILSRPSKHPSSAPEYARSWNRGKIEFNSQKTNFYLEETRKSGMRKIDYANFDSVIVGGISGFGVESDENRCGEKSISFEFGEKGAEFRESETEK